MEKMLFHLVTSPSVHMHENCYFCSTLLSLFNERCPQWIWCSFIITFICMILFYGQRLVNYNFLLCRISNKKGNTKIYYLVVVIMIEKSFFYVKNSYKSFVISLTKCKTSYKQCFNKLSWICWTGGGSVCSFSFGLCLLSFWRTLCVQ